MNKTLLLPIFVALTFSIRSQTVSLAPSLPDSLFVTINFPDSDSVVTSLSRYRFGARTQPYAKAYVNGVAYKVFPTGAFAGLLPLQPGDNVFQFTIKTSSGDSVTKHITIHRTTPKTFSPDTFVIDEQSLEPSKDIWLCAGEVLEVRMRATPGHEATFDIPGVATNLPMEEVTVKNGRTPTTMYVGKYTIRENDMAIDQPIIFRIKKSFWSRKEAISKGRITVFSNQLPRVAEIVGKRPYLTLSYTGTRLGAEKLGFVQEGVQVLITGKIGSFYKTQLTPTFTAWIHEEFVKFLSPFYPMPLSIVRSITVNSTTTHDIVSLPLDIRLPYSSELQLSSSLIVDIYGATSNTTWIQQDVNTKSIASVSCTQVEDRRYRITINLKSEFHWGYDIDYSGTTLKIKINNPPVIRNKTKPLTGLTIALDAGHGGDDNKGAVGATGVFEKDITLAIVRDLQKELQDRGATIFLTRSNNENIPTPERIEPLLRSNATLLLSIHCNSCGEASDPINAAGTSVYYKHIGFKPLADILYSKLLATGLQPYGVIGNFNFLLNSITQIPNVLVETAFLSNPAEEQLLLSAEFRRKLAIQLADGIEEYIKVATGQ